MGRESVGGLLKSVLRDSVEDCANNDDTKNTSVIAVRRITCGNLEDKVDMLWITPAC
jgi:hypothetical protein